MTDPRSTLRSTFQHFILGFFASLALGAAANSIESIGLYILDDMPLVYDALHVAPIIDIQRSLP
jgi:hypothetical protein